MDPLSPTATPTVLFEEIPHKFSVMPQLEVRSVQVIPSDEVRRVPDAPVTTKPEL